jgi:hypothetical protein
VLKRDVIFGLQILSGAVHSKRFLKANFINRVRHKKQLDKQHERLDARVQGVKQDIDIK